MPGGEDCAFCAIGSGEAGAHVVLDEPELVAFLDTRPLFDGHVLLCPRDHIGTLPELPRNLATPLVDAAQRLCRAVELAMGAEGTFVAVNNVVSQSVPHLHVHVVPRRRRDGLKGFFWPRQGRTDEEALAVSAARIRTVLAPPSP